LTALLSWPPRAKEPPRRDGKGEVVVTASEAVQDILGSSVSLRDDKSIGRARSKKDVSFGCGQRIGDIPLTQQLYEAGPIAYTTATCIPNSAFEGYVVSTPSLLPHQFSTSSLFT
jgi:hypothetical protein